MHKRFQYKWLMILFFSYVILFKEVSGIGQTISQSYQQINTSTELHDTSKVTELMKLANLYYLAQPDSTYIIIEKAVELAEKSNYVKGLNGAYGWMAYFIGAKGR